MGKIVNAFKRELGKSLPFLSPRLDGIREFAVTKELCSLYEQMESKQFDFYGNAEVNGNVAIGSNVWVNGNARIQSRDDCGLTAMRGFNLVMIYAHSVISVHQTFTPQHLRLKAVE